MTTPSTTFASDGVRPADARRTVSIDELRHICTQTAIAQVDVAGVPMPTEIETLHLLIRGASSVELAAVLHRLIPSALARGDRLFVLDQHGDLYRRFGRSDDVLLAISDSQFLVQEWVKSGKGSLYLTWPDATQDLMNSKVSAWVDRFCTALLSLTPTPTRRWWLILADLASIEPIESLAIVVGTGRKCGTSVVAAQQSPSSAYSDRDYQKERALLANFHSVVVFSGPDDDFRGAAEISRNLGMHQENRVSISETRHWTGFRIKSKHENLVVIPIVTPAEIMALPELTGWIMFAGGRPISRFVLEP